MTTCLLSPKMCVACSHLASDQAERQATGLTVNTQCLSYLFRSRSRQAEDRNRISPAIFE